jgi:hypothetical protein
MAAVEGEGNGGLSTSGDGQSEGALELPRMLLLHGQFDSIIPLEATQVFAQRLRVHAWRSARAQAVAGCTDAAACLAAEDASPGRAGCADAAHSQMQHATAPASSHAPVLVAEGMRHSFSWLLSPTTLAAHDAVLAWTRQQAARQ